MCRFLQGGSRGYLYILLHVGLYALVSVWATLLYASTHDFNIGVPLAISAYLIIYLGLACALGRGLNRLSSDIKPGHTRVLTLILLAICCVAPHLRLLWSNAFSYTYSIVQITDPFSTLVEIGEHRWNNSTQAIALLLGLGVIAVLLLNLRAIKQGIAEVVSADVRRRTAEEPVLNDEAAEFESATVC